MKIRKTDYGKRITIRYDDIGCVDAMLLDESRWPKEYQAYIFATSELDVSVPVNQIVEIGKPIQPR